MQLRRCMSDKGHSEAYTKDAPGVGRYCCCSLDLSITRGMKFAWPLRSSIWRNAAYIMSTSEDKSEFLATCVRRLYSASTMMISVAE